MSGDRSCSGRKYRGFFTVHAGILLAVFFIAFLSWTSCTVRAIKQAEVTKPRDEDTLLSELMGFNSAVKNIEGRALAVYRDGERTYSFRVLIAADKSSEQIRMDISDFVFKVPLFTIIRRGEDVLLIHHSKKTVSEMRFRELDFSTLFSLEVSKDLLLGAILGEVVVIEGKAVFSDTQQPLLLRIQGSNAEQTIAFNQDFIPFQMQYRYDSRLLTIDFSKFEQQKSVSFPKKIDLKQGSRSLYINYTELHLNQGIEVSRFDLQEDEIDGFSWIN